MTTQTNNRQAMPADVPLIERLSRADDVRLLLDEWDTAITDLDCALRENKIARSDLLVVEDAQRCAEARVSLRIEGKNEAERRARLTLALEKHREYQAACHDIIGLKERIWDAEREAAVAKERCRLLRAALALVTDRTDS